MVKAGAEPLDSRRVLRGWIIGAALFAATAAVVLWQNAHVAVLFDLSYALNTAARIALGQMPYRDFPLPHAPITFLTQAAIIRLTGRVFFHNVLYVALAGGLATVITWRLAVQTLRERVAAPWIIALLLAAPLVFLGIYCIVPSPEYDCDCAFWILVALWFLQRVDAKPRVAVGFFAGIFACVPVFCKQNMGLPFLAVVVGAVGLVLAAKWTRSAQNSTWRPEVRTLLAVMGGVCAALAAAALVLHWTAGIGNYLGWTMRYAGQRRLPAFSLMFSMYRDPALLWTLPCVAIALLLLHSKKANRNWAQIAAFALLTAPFLFTLASLMIYDDADERGDSLLALWPLLLLLATALAIVNLLRLPRAPSLRACLPLILLAAINGTFMSQQLWGSTYAIWPLLVLLAAELLAILDGFTARAWSRWFTPTVAALISVTLLVCGGFYTVSEERLSYAELPDGPVQHSAFPQLAGLSTPGPYLPEIDELLRFAQANIPFNDGIVLMPGEEPFYFATGRVQRFPVLFFDPTVDPYSPAEIAALVRSCNIRWLIVKRNLQTKEDPTPDRAATMQVLMPKFTLAAHLSGYDVYRAKPPE